MSDFILTYSKIKFYPLEPIKSDIRIEDIAHALSLMTRANGHFKHFYSVAQHAVNCCKEAKARGYSARVQLGCLLHDASESYISDLTRPVKRNLSQYFVIEEKLQNIIYDRFGLGDLTSEEQEMIRAVDDSQLYFEFKALMDIDISDSIPSSFIEHDYSQRDFVSVEKEFLSLFKRLTGKSKAFCCLGVDGCKGGWVAAAITDEGFNIEVFRSISEITLKYQCSDSILIDMPIGLPEAPEDIRPDNAARKILTSKASSIFSTPCRQAVYCDDYTSASELNRTVLGKGLSKQSHAICNKIREIDEFLSDMPQFKNRILESHPEVCFAMLNSGKPVLENKKTEEGLIKRIQILSKHYPETQDAIEYMFKHPDLKRIKDDVIDAFCLAVTGVLGINAKLRAIPKNPMEDKKGLLMQIVYAEPVHLICQIIRDKE